MGGLEEHGGKFGRDLISWIKLGLRIKVQYLAWTD